MGLATVVENIGEGLYVIRLNYDLAAVRYELGELEVRHADYFAEVNRALDSLDLLRQERNEARAGLDEVVGQWKDALIDKLDQLPPPIEPEDPIDPGTGEPWIDPDRAQDGPLFDAINAARTAAGVAVLARDADLDTAMLQHLRELGGGNRGGHFSRNGAKPAQRAAWAFYSYDPDTGVGELLAPGARSPDAAVERWQRSNVELDILLGEDYVDCGVGFLNAPASIYGYLWGAMFAAPGTPPPEIEVEKDPAQDAAEDAEDQIESIPVPSVSDFAPQKLAEAAARFATAAHKVRIAEILVQTLRIDQLQRTTRIAELIALIAALENVVIDAWCVNYATGLQGEISTIEVPGWYLQEGVERSATLFEGTPQEFSATYTERAINIGFNGGRGAAPASQLKPGEGMTAAAVYFNAAMEPGHFRWQPLWRYGILTTDGEGDVCNLTLNVAEDRGREGYDINSPGDPIGPDGLDLIGVPIVYPPCGGSVFKENDEVVVYFPFGWETPSVIGFRREPKRCAGSSWQQIL
jgi:hypothetical protein